MEWYYIAMIALAAVILIMLVIATYISFKQVISRYRSKEEKNKKSVWDDENYIQASYTGTPWSKTINEGKEYIRSHVTESYAIKSYDGLTLKARLVPAKEQKGIILMMHGFRSNPVHDFSCAVRFLNENGFSCVLPYQRAHGDSEGKYLCFGTKEKYDVISWCRFIEEHFPDLPVIVDGMSMGSTSVLMASGLEMPKSVCGIVADCGFTSPAEIFKEVARNRLKMSHFPLLYTTWAAARVIAGFGFGESTKKALEKNTLPILFIHGEADDFVPHYMTEENYEVASKHCDAKFLSVPDAGHGLSYLVDTKKYTDELRAFLGKCTSAVKN